jgi:hypothetical protein
MFQMKMTSNGRLPQISKVKYLSNYWLDLSQILNLAVYDQRELCKCFKWRQPQMEDDLKWKTTLCIKSEISQPLLVGSSPNFKVRLMWPKQTLQMCKMNITSNGRSPKMVRSSPNFKLRLMWPKQTLQIFKWRWPQMEDDIKWSTNSNIISETTTGQILPKSFWPNRTYKCFKWRQPPLDDNFKYQQNPVGSSSNWKCKLSWPNKTLQMF